MYEGNKDYEKFLRDRITKLRIEKNLSERQLSFELGHCEGYINKITPTITTANTTNFFNLFTFTSNIKILISNLYYSKTWNLAIYPLKYMFCEYIK